MGTVSRFHDRTRPPAHRIESEEEAIATARRLAVDFALQASERDINRVFPRAELDALFQSGLAAVTIPPEHEGLDVANALLGEIVAIIAQGDSSIGECLEQHFTALEGLRNEPDDERKTLLFARALAGDHFVGATFAETSAATPVGRHYPLSGRSSRVPGILFADWIAADAVDAQGQSLRFYLSCETPGLQIIDDWDGFGQRTNGAGTAVAHDVTGNGEAARHTTAPVLAALLHAGTDLGIARAALSNLRDAPRSAAVGKLALSVQAAAALVESAGTKLDFAQVSPSTAATEAAFFSASAAKVMASRTALDVANALFEWSGNDATSIGRNLDRHWRNARIRANATATDDLYRTAAAYYFGDN
ncbi:MULTISPECIES: monooxygenase [unclassified Rhizobium]|uniref:monooxygenase n=1 Tax=unclassified Rhizobium TaxID=2613769 RepID=UPI001622EED4|nr:MULTISPECIES: monooxygenase [unclassified Rhizobium]MBB3541234.1 alkylation response protein AidB-like acyl-CoA dehydrogenase [Rhizobium sp. BK399]MCS3739959.1 alkylation response protein AidB-like acyl-CoA dehydrogenase [Rhizobium sp. BK661]MCS4092091.1 alkylation response protein AidB-like acyl-CoA dehydrogenase [Rhizobium sp. BK176]